MWDGWVDVEKPRTHIVGHWNYKNGVKKNIYVVSSSEKVELFLNGKSLGFGEQSNRFLFTFKNINWQAGEIKAVGYDKNGKIVSENIKKTAGEPFAIKLTPRTSPNGFYADGHDIALVDVEAVDKDGNRNPIALNEIKFELSGEAEWRGGIAQGKDNFILSKTLPVENGVNRVLIRSTTKAGKITLKATADGLRSAEISLNSLPFKSENGLSSTIFGGSLPVNLSRGATPLGESFKVTRKTIDVAKITAGSNQDKTSQTIDDNELTEWLSDGQIENALDKFRVCKA